MFNLLLKQTKALRNSGQYLSVVWLFWTTLKDRNKTIECQLRSMTPLQLTLKMQLQTHQNVRFLYLLISARTLPNQDNEANNVFHLDSITGFYKEKMMPCNLKKNPPNPTKNPQNQNPTTFSVFSTTPNLSSPNYKCYEPLKIRPTNAFWGS